MQLPATEIIPRMAIIFSEAVNVVPCALNQISKMMKAVMTISKWYSHFSLYESIIPIVQVMAANMKVINSFSGITHNTSMLKITCNDKKVCFFIT